MIQNGIEFTINPNDSYTIISKKLSIESASKLNAGKVSPTINAIAIDWNNAKIDDNLFINTTGELISWIKEEFANINNVISNINLNNGLTLQQAEAINYLINFVNQIKNDTPTHIISEDNYYFYVGLDKPTDNTIITSVAGARQTGWHLIGNSIDGYSYTSPIYKGSTPSQTINVNSDYEDVYFYVAIPVGLSLHDDLGNVIDNLFFDTANVTINGHSYNIFKIYNSDFLARIY